jgi:hypothetical protein
MKDTIRVRIAVAVDSGGEWNANGWGGLEQPYEPDAMSMARECVGSDAAQYWIEAELPIPRSRVSGDAPLIAGEVTAQDG